MSNCLPYHKNTSRATTTAINNTMCNAISLFILKDCGSTTLEGCFCHVSWWDWAAQTHHHCLHLLHTRECISVSLQPLFEEDTDLAMAFRIHKQMRVPWLNSLETPHTTQTEFKPICLCSPFTGLLCFSLHDR